MCYIQLAGAKLLRILQPAKGFCLFLLYLPYFTTTFFTSHVGADSLVLVYWKAT
jgi:hypothetical protein